MAYLRCGTTGGSHPVSVWQTGQSECSVSVHPKYSRTGGRTSLGSAWPPVAAAPAGCCDRSRGRREQQSQWRPPPVHPHTPRPLPRSSAARIADSPSAAWRPRPAACSSSQQPACVRGGSRCDAVDRSSELPYPVGDALDTLNVHGDVDLLAARGGCGGCGGGGHGHSARVAGAAVLHERAQNVL